MSESNDTTNEVWKEIPGYEGRYQVSDMGRVRSLSRDIPRDGRHRRKNFRLEGRVLRQSKIGKYHMVGLRLNTRTICWLVHRAVMAAFVGPCPPGMQCLHENDQQNDNRLSNLRWGTPKENGEDSIRNGRVCSGERCHLHKLTRAEVVAIKDMIRNGIPVGQIAALYPVGRPAISQIKRGKNWKGVS